MKSQENSRIVFTFLKQECIFYYPSLYKPPEIPFRIYCLIDISCRGWAWLVQDRGTKLRIVTTKNQDTPLPQGLVPLLPLDVWEHSYFLQYYSERAAYIKNWFALIDWSYVEKRYLNEHS